MGGDPPRKRSVRLGGALEPANREISTARARVVFLEIAAATSPRVLESLRANAVGLYPNNDWRSPLEVWCAEYHVTDRWLRKCAEDTLRMFVLQKPLGTQFEDPVTRELRPLTEKDLNRWDVGSLSAPLRFPLPRGKTSAGDLEADLGFRTREQEIERLTREKEAHGGGLTQYRARDTLAEITSALKEHGWLKPPTKAVRHFEWLSLYQFDEVSVTKLAQVREDDEVRREGVTDRARSSVTEAVCRTADLIGLTLRPPVTCRGPV